MAFDLDGYLKDAEVRREERQAAEEAKARQEAEDAKLDDVKEQIKSEIMQKKQQEAYTAKVEALKKKYMA